MTAWWSALGCSVVLLLPACKNDLDRVAAMEVADGGPYRVTTEGEYLYSDSGRVRNKVRAGRILEFNGDKPQTLLEEGVELTFFQADGRAGSRLSARRGEIEPGGRRMSVSDQVVFVNTQGERLETEKLTWSQDSNKVFTDRPVKITRRNDIIYGQGLDAEEDFSRYTVRRVTGTLFIDRSDTLAPTESN
ncbi:MAG: LPS export ABC transporter periplasmic protein LptC [Flavobacteriales bacterium]|nr:LPS export ABC transporter periplasmic protein LptC [Flavobacteriales bacterium]MBP9079142.1 LPS export ABC transporter periplasmic protein LptC [Flavobacteriales bacterium]